MKKLASTLPNMLLSLTLIAAVAAALLAFVYQTTEPVISASKIATLKSGIDRVVPEHDNVPFEEELMVDDYKIYPARKGGELVGYAVESYTNNGFAGLVKVLVGIDKEGNIIDYTVLQQAETPGLGSKMEAWFRGEKGSVLGMNLTTPLQVTKDGGQVNAISAATISSRAFLETLNGAYAVVQKAIADGQLK
ncbi:RnfABCDGE type electron transport complex subunit G [Porphyromonas levii]|uniref:Ion-translocating oxidoreductase complex subunit G n=1 Tax=Porphyromonas levii TaxID=28114 RepID=A0A4Y8WND5_9PORP|nr:RnfABCDGE type electron transport complex subunit G [Porphyromonas levii]MBR8702761.1 Ion-translocating oxidoreductase complex subunit G [Porphyromonas levii]MBR8714013.1 Ion-translocating oxidoreductase complex subunit G [Porphyromonas levii]MBR8715369.1 Ion-translocating oxidoreductase complex subunit G [Porphyromonas levii]MBR8727907.1 Ion-translocating oxidoreductase complex subunit G [Porphyromonas levii]MBR8729919.1 Ion-translocating oxidoreductase complex subunit G [Porphyromonas lev